MSGREGAEVELWITAEDTENIISGLYAFLPRCSDALAEDLLKLIAYVEAQRDDAKWMRER